MEILKLTSAQRKQNAVKTLLITFFTITNIAFSQEHIHHNVHNDTLKIEKESTQMTSFLSPNLSMSRDGSGTSWQPDSSPMRMYMSMKKNTSMRIHGSFYLRYTSQDITNQSNRGGNHLDAPNMFMFSLSHKLTEKNLFSIMSMFSFEPFTVGSAGYPLLFQTGESHNGIQLVDRQHPHDLFSQLAVNYTHTFTKDIDINTYFGYPGEPALGSGSFAHRLSAMNNPDAPLGHHWQDATHITFGVGTLGFRYKNVKLESSIFTGREPDENRYNFDKSTFDSYSYRISVNPNKNFSLQFSQGFIKSPEELFPDKNITRITASVIHTKQIQQEKFISSAIIWGMNHQSDARNLNSILFESNLQLKDITIYTRYEFVQKDAHELQLLQFSNNPIFDINALTLGLNKTLINKVYNISIGAQATINLPDEDLKSIYGNSPLAGQLYLKLSPPTAHIHNMTNN